MTFGSKVLYTHCIVNLYATRKRYLIPVHLSLYIGHFYQIKGHTRLFLELRFTIKSNTFITFAIPERKGKQMGHRCSCFEINFFIVWGTLRIDKVVSLMPSKTKGSCLTNYQIIFLTRVESCIMSF